MKPLFKSMLFCNEEWDWSDVSLPAMVQPKLDGVAAYKSGGEIWTKRGKPFPNLHINMFLKETLEEGMDCEIWHPDMAFHQVSGFCRRIKDTPPSGWCAVVYDRSRPYVTEPYSKRYQRLLSWYSSSTHLHKEQKIQVMDSVICHTVDEIEAAHILNVGRGQEGSMIRAVHAPYYHGRTGIKDGFGFKFVGLEYDTAVFHGCTKNSNAQKAETLIGSIVALHPKWGVIHVGSGFGHALSADMYANPGRYRGQVFTFKYKKHGTDEKPRQPIFVDFEGK
tara:strand:+ start:10334 stop:11167 length:834 start_codon:yes stop_codon:yes gene_type:complete